MDGAMGTLIQEQRLSEEDYHGKRFSAHPSSLNGNNEILVLTQPELIADIHRKYLNAGSDIIATNTFTANRISQADYGTCLLYTSPSPRDVEESRMPSSA